MGGAPTVYREPLPETIVRATTIDDLIEKNRKERLELEAKKPVITSSPVLVTAVMPVRDMFLTLGRSVFRLAPGAQSVPIDLVVIDGGSGDPCADVLSGAPQAKFVDWCEHTIGIHKVTVLPSVTPITRNFETGEPLSAYEIKNRNIEWLEKKLTLEVKTKYVLYVDADVEIPVDCVRAMLDVMELEEGKPAGYEKTVMTGVLYDWSADHVKFGCALARMEVMKDFDFRSDAGCPCRWTHQELRRLGWKVSYLPPETLFRSGYGGIRMDGTHGRYNWR